MAYKSITTVVTDFGADKGALVAAEDLARAHEGHLDIICLGLDRTQPGFYYAGTNAMIVQSNLEQAKADAQEIESAVTDYLRASDVTWATEPMATQMVGLTPFLAHQTRFSDLVVLPRPYGEGRSNEHEEILESTLFNAHAPVVVVPDDAKLPPSPKRIVIGWNESSEALRAVRAAMPLLKAADLVDIVIIDPPTHGPDRSDPGGALSQKLARHGVNCEVSVLAKTMPRTSDTLMRHVADKSADIVVMGAYGHSRFRESILGGATRDMLTAAPVPVLMTH